MTGQRRRNDLISTGPAVPGLVLHLLLPVVAGAAAALLLPVLGWQIAVVGVAVIGMLFPQTLAGWLSIGCLAVGMLLTGPALWKTMLAVLLVHVIHVLCTLLPLVPWRGGVVLRALRPTLVRLLVVQLIAQPLTLGVLFVGATGTVPVVGAVLVGAASAAGFAVLFVVSIRRRSNGV